MKVATFMLSLTLCLVSAPAAAEWTFIGVNTIGDQFFVDLATLKKGARPRAWTMVNYFARSKYGDLSNKSLREIDCSEDKMRFLADRFYTEPMGGGAPSSASDQPSEWSYLTPNSMNEEMARTICSGNK